MGKQFALGHEPGIGRGAVGERAQQRAQAVGMGRTAVLLSLVVLLKDGTQQPGGALGALGVAAYPVEVVGRARGQRRPLTGGHLLASGLQPERDLLLGLRGQHPGVLAAAARLVRHQQAAPAGRDPGQAAGHDRVIGVARDEEGTQHRGAWFHPLDAQRRRGGKTQDRLADPAARLGEDAGAQLLQFRLAAGGPEERSAARRAGQRLDDHPRKMGQHVAAVARLAAPPGLDRLQPQRLAEEVTGDRREETQQGGVLQQAAAQRVGHRHAAPTHAVEQPGHAELRLGPQLERVAPVVVDPAQDHVDRLRRGQRALPDTAAAHGQVVALDQRIAEIAREIRVLEVGLVERARREDHDPRLPARRSGGDGRQALAQRAEEHRHAVHARIAEQRGQDARDHHPVLERVACARGRLGTIAQHDHPPVRRAGEVGRVEDELAVGED